MSSNQSDRFSAGEQGLGYIYQPRFALLKMLEMPESVCVFIEKDDDLDFLEVDGKKSLASLKHKAEGDRLTDLSTDFWKSVRIWIDRYNSAGGICCELEFILFTTAEVAENSFLKGFVSSGTKVQEVERQTQFETAVDRSQAKIIKEVSGIYEQLTHDEKGDFISRISIVPKGTRIDQIQDQIVNLHMKVVRRDFRKAVFERLEGWWNQRIIEILEKDNDSGLFGYEISDKLAEIAQEYRDDNLPIHFSSMRPETDLDVNADRRLFVLQLREIGVSDDRIRRAVFDYYRAFHQRSLWARENVLISGEVENYESRISDEWGRYKEIIEEELDEEATEDALKKAGRKIYNWAQMETDNLRIRERVSEPYVVRGCFHMLANNKPTPRVYWHPMFMERLNEVLGENS